MRVRASSCLPCGVEHRERSIVIRSAQSRSAYSRGFRMESREDERRVTDLCLLDVLVASKLWGKGWHGWCAEQRIQTRLSRRGLV